MIPPILNASGCLDALTAPSVVERLDAFVTKTVTPLPREGNPPPRIAETESGMLNSIGLQNPGIDAFVRDNLPRLATLGVPIWVSVGGFSAGDYALLCARLDECADVDDDRAESLLPERRGGAGDGCRARRGGARRNRKAALREAFAGHLGRRGVRACRRGRRSRRPLARQHDPRARIRAHAPATRPRPRGRRLLRPGLATDRPRLRVRLRRGGRAPDRRHGRDRLGTRCGGFPQRRCELGRARNDSLLRSLGAGSPTLGARSGGRSARRGRGRPGAGIGRVTHASPDPQTLKLLQIA